MEHSFSPGRRCSWGFSRPWLPWTPSSDHIDVSKMAIWKGIQAIQELACLQTSQQVSPRPGAWSQSASGPNIPPAVRAAWWQWDSESVNLDISGTCKHGRGHSGQLISPHPRRCFALRHWSPCHEDCGKPHKLRLMLPCNQQVWVLFNCNQ